MDQLDALRQHNLAAFLPYHPFASQAISRACISSAVGLLRVLGPWSLETEILPSDRMLDPRRYRLDTHARICVARWTGASEGTPRNHLFRDPAFRLQGYPMYHDAAVRRDADNVHDTAFKSGSNNR